MVSYLYNQCKSTLRGISRNKMEDLEFVKFILYDSIWEIIS